ncbi:MAG: CHRD domain-containing protein [Candidatus Limnocylindria bacterium]
MRSRFGTPLVLAFVLGLLASLALSGAVVAAETTLTATLAGVTEGENPGNPDGSGTASVVLDPATGEACWELMSDGIGAVTQSHIHVGAAGASGGVVVPLDVDGFDGTSEGCTSDVDAAVLQAVIDNPAGHYVNLHTEDFPAGAIRGQLAGAGAAPNTATPVPGTDGPIALLGALMAALALGIGLRAWRPLATRD